MRFLKARPPGVRRERGGRDRRAALTSHKSGRVTRRAPAGGRLRGVWSADAWRKRRRRRSRSAGAELQTNPRNPPRFQQFTRPRWRSWAPPRRVHAPPASGAGDTGFDSTNTRRKIKRKAGRNRNARRAKATPHRPTRTRPRRQCGGGQPQAVAPGVARRRPSRAIRRRRPTPAPSPRRRERRRSNSAQSGNAAKKTQGAYRAGRSLRAARRACRRLRSVPGGRTDRRLQTPIPRTSTGGRPPRSIPSRRNCGRSRTGRGTNSRPSCAAAIPATAPTKRRR